MSSFAVQLRKNIRKMIAELEAMSVEEFRARLVKLGINTKTGKLTKKISSWR